MARASLSLLVHAVVLAAFFLRPSVAAQSRAANISAVEAAVRDRALQLLRGGGAGRLVDVTVGEVGLRKRRPRPPTLKTFGVHTVSVSREGPSLQGH
jgi:hypothetical protein